MELIGIQALSYDGHDKQFFDPKERHIVITMPVLNVKWFASCLEHISYII